MSHKKNKTVKQQIKSKAYLSAALPGKFSHEKLFGRKIVSVSYPLAQAERIEQEMHACEIFSAAAHILFYIFS